MPEEMQRAGHLFGKLNGDRGKKLLLIGHLDTVFEPGDSFQTFKREGSKAIGPGTEDMKSGNVIIVYALKALLPPLVEQRKGQVVINTSASSLRPRGFAALNCATRAGANALIQASALTVASYGVTLNGTGTYAMNYPSFLHDIGADSDPQIRREVEAALPMGKLCEPEEAAYFVASLIDGKATYQTAQYYAIDGGWSQM